MIFLVIILTLLVFNASKPINYFRTFFERHLVIPIRTYFQPFPKSENSLKITSLKEQIRQLKSENKLMRQQLGAIPEKADLLPSKVIWQGESELIVTYQLSEKQNLKGAPVVLGEVFLGTVIRQSPSFLVVRMPISSTYVSDGINEQNISGKLKGQFNNQVLFETESKQLLTKNSRVYYLNKEKGWRFYLGKISHINQNKRLAFQQALVDFEAGQIQLHTVFVAL